jgi:hypothetical protein
MEGRRFDPKELAIEGFYSLKDLVEQFVSDFRSSDRFFKYKAAIIAGWLAVSGTTLGLSCSGGPRQNSLRAHTQVTRVLDDQSLLVRNDSTSTWKEVRLTLNGKYTAFTPEIAAGGKFVLGVKQFVGPEGQVPAKDLRPVSLRLSCSEGNEEIDLTRPELEEP